MSLHMTVVGDQALREKLRRLERQSPAAARDVINTVAFLVEADAKRACPVDTGRLRASIGVTPASTAALGTLTAFVGTNVNYAPFVELGTRRQHAQPFLFPAAELHGRTLARLVNEALRRLV